MLLAVLVTSAAGDDAAAAQDLTAQVDSEAFPRLRKVYGDNKYNNYALSGTLARTFFRGRESRKKGGRSHWPPLCFSRPSFAIEAKAFSLHAERTVFRGRTAWPLIPVISLSTPGILVFGFSWQVERGDDPIEPSRLQPFMKPSTGVFRYRRGSRSV